MTNYQCYRTMSWTSDSDECEAGCGTLMCEQRYVQGQYGHYCSKACRDNEEASGSDDDAGHERRQMGLTQ